MSRTEATSTEEGQRSPREKTMTVAGVLAVGAVGAISSAIYFSNNSDDDAATGDDASTEETVEVADGRGQATVGDEGRVEAVYAAADILSAAFVEADSEEEYVELLSAMDEGDFSGVDEEVQEGVRLVDVFEDDDPARATAYQSLISISAMIKETREIDAEDDITPAVDDDELADLVLYDQDLGTAYIPLSIFAPDFAVFTMEMVYTEDGEWVLAPYSLMEGVTIYTMAEQQVLQQFENQEGADIAPEDIEGMLEEGAEDAGTED